MTVTTIDSTVATIDTTDQLQDQIDIDLEDDDDDDDARGSSVAAWDNRPGRKLSKAEQRREAEEIAERDRIQALVPWKVLRSSAWGQASQIDTWMDESGHFPTEYRGYTADEWKAAIAVLADAVERLRTIDGNYQKQTGLYVEEHTDTYLLIRGKKWQFQMAITGKASTTGKKLELGAAPGRDNYGFASERPGLFAEFLKAHIPGEEYERILNMVSQYMPEIRKLLNREVWAEENPTIAELLEYGK
jgi:hypothetical protein